MVETKVVPSDMPVVKDVAQLALGLPVVDEWRTACQCGGQVGCNTKLGSCVNKPPIRN